VGPSGCGKTTLLHAIDELLPLPPGAIESHGLARAMVFQRPRLLPWRTVLSNATFGIECRGRGGDEATAKARTLLGRMGLSDQLECHPHELSEGMKQRVNLARALLVEPELLLMDEPFSALDLLTRRALHADLLELWEERGFTVVFVSHSLEEVVTLADRVAVLGPGSTGLRHLEQIDLARPRRADPAASLRLLERVEELSRLLEP
jgi:NitT/TauT family transport system ATP-binding protein